VVVPSKSPSSPWTPRLVACGLLAVLVAHLAVLLTSHEPLERSVLSKGLQILSVSLAYVFALRASLRSRGFSRTFWALSGTGFALILAGQFFRLFEPGEGAAFSDFLFLLHVVPFGLALLLTERPRWVSAAGWPLVFDYLQIVIIVVTTFIGFVYVPSRALSPGAIDPVLRAFATLLIARNVVITAGFWFRTSCAGSVRERSAFRSMAIYLLFYSVGSALTHYIFLTASPIPSWIELEGSVPFLLAAWLFSRWQDLPASQTHDTKSVRELAALYLIPAALPCLVVLLAVRLMNSVPLLVSWALSASALAFALRLLTTTYSEHQAMVALRLSEERYRSLVVATSEIVWRADIEGQSLKDESTWCKFTGQRQEDCAAWGWMDAIHPEDRERVAQAWSRAVRVPFLFETEYRLRRIDGEYRYMAVHGVPILKADGTVREWLGTCADITARMESEDALHNEQIFSDIIVETLPGVFYVCDESGRLLRWNKNMEEISQKSASELGQMTYGDLISPEDRSLAQQKIQETLQTGASSMEARVVSKQDKKNSLFLFTAARLQIGGRPGWVGVGIDISERKRTEEKYRSLESQFLQAQKMEAIGRLAGGVAHDFNNILAVILGYGELLLKQQDLSVATRKRVGEITAAAKSAASLIGQLIAFSGKQILQPKVINVNDVISETRAMLARVIGEHIQLETSFKASAATIKADPSQIQQVLMNLVVNARDAMPNGGRLEIAISNVTRDDSQMYLEAGGCAFNYLLLSVSDTGCGMDTTILAHLFEPFFTTKEKGKGTGLGLSTVFGIVEKSGGKISVSSQPGQGTTFRLYFPTVEPIAAEPSPKRLPTTIAGSGTILLVEDEVSLRRVTRLQLENSGYRVLESTSPSNAIEIAKTVEGTIDLLLTDVVMPGISGPEVATRVRQIRPETKVLYVTGYSEAIADDSRLLGSAWVLQKPFTQEELVRKIREVLRPVLPIPASTTEAA
jgi:two-component system cell cycle sensor histidine kinase/response regulator CckA